jgi:type IV secretory pathway VirB2 component (pilin)
MTHSRACASFMNAFVTFSVAICCDIAFWADAGSVGVENNLRQIVNFIRPPAVFLGAVFYRCNNSRASFV